MLSKLEKVIFLKEIPFFERMTTEQLRVIANISEDAEFEKGAVIIEQDTICDALYIIVSGSVRIQQVSASRRNITRLSDLKSREYFAEMSLFAEAPYPSEVIAMEAVQLLLVRQEPLLALIEQQPALALRLLRVMGERLCQANEVIAQKSRTRTRKLEDFYDKMETETETTEPS